MATRPNPSWSEPQKKLHKDFQEAMEIIIPYSGPEIPRLDNHTPEQICDQLGVVKAVKSKVDAVEKTLKERFKPRMPTKELRGTRYVATLTDSTRVALNQEKAKQLLSRADELGVDLEKLVAGLEEGSIDLQEIGISLKDGLTNTQQFMTSTDVETLNVKAI